VNNPPGKTFNAAADWFFVVMLIVAETGEEPAINALGAEPNEHDASWLAPAGELVSAHFRFTCPVKLPKGVTVIVELPEPPRLAMVTDVPESAKPGGTIGAFTVTAIFPVAAVMPAAVAVTAMV
jgi:hypothetical protein